MDTYGLFSEGHNQILTPLCNYRNTNVDVDAENQEIESCVFQLKNIVEELIYFCINNSSGFLSTDDVVNFLDLPFENDVLKSPNHIR